MKRGEKQTKIVITVLRVLDSAAELAPDGDGYRRAEKPRYVDIEHARGNRYESLDELVEDLAGAPVRGYEVKGDEIVSRYVGDYTGWPVERWSRAWEEFLRGEEELFEYVTRVKFRATRETAEELDPERAARELAERRREKPNARET